MLSALALLSGALLSVFAQLSSLRLRLTDRPEERYLDIERDGIDEAVAHLLFAFLLCIITCALLTIGMSTSYGGKDAPLILGTFWTAPISAFTTYIFALFVIGSQAIFGICRDESRAERTQRLSQIDIP